MGKPIGYHLARLQRAFRTIIYFPQTVGLRSNKNNVKKTAKEVVILFCHVLFYTQKNKKRSCAYSL